MSDDEDVQLMEDGPEGGCMDEEAQLFGAAQAFDAVTGMPVPRAGSAATSASSSSNERRAAELADIAAQVTAKPEPVWNLTLAQKNESNTGDIKVPHMLGIDEAGRGPVLGSMVYGICWCPISKLDDLKALRVADSKTLTHAQRTGLFRAIQECPWLGYEVDVIGADRLSVEMLRRQKVSLNVISHDSAIGLIQSVLSHGVNVREVFVDTVGDAGKYQEKLQSIFPSIAITVSKKADSLFPAVSAASIAAKVVRDEHLESWRHMEEVPRPNGRATPFSSPFAHSLTHSRRVGSGYPGDPLTKVWLCNHLDPVFGYPALVRFSWGTTKKILKAQAVQAEFGDEDDEEENNEGDNEAEEAGTQKMDKFFSKEAAAAPSAAEAAKKAEKASAAAAAAAALVAAGDPNNKKFSLLHEGVTRKKHAVPHTQRIGWFQQHRMDLATTF